MLGFVGGICYLVRVLWDVLWKVIWLRNAKDPATASARLLDEKSV